MFSSDVKKNFKKAASMIYRILFIWACLIIYWSAFSIETAPLWKRLMIPIIISGPFVIAVYKMGQLLKKKMGQQKIV